MTGPNPPPTADHNLYCPTCDYNLRGQTTSRCPECGEPYDLHALKNAVVVTQASYRAWRRIAVSYACATFALAYYWGIDILGVEPIGSLLRMYNIRPQDWGHGVYIASLTIATIAAAIIAYSARRALEHRNCKGVLQWWIYTACTIGIQWWVLYTMHGCYPRIPIWIESFPLWYITVPLLACALAPVRRPMITATLQRYVIRYRICICTATLALAISESVIYWFEVSSHRGRCDIAETIIMVLAVAGAGLSLRIVADIRRAMH